MNLSIITPTFNSASTLLCCLRSIASQTYPAEHLIIDGASTDPTLALVRTHSPSAHILSEPDKGMYDAMNKGIALAHGEVIGILNADDFYAGQTVLEQVARAFADPTVMCCYGDLEYIAELPMKDDRGELPSPSFKVVRYWRSCTFTPASFYWGWMPPHPTFFVRRSLYEQYGRFRLDLGSAADYELMLRFLLKHGAIAAYIPEVLVRMRVGGTSNRSWNARLKANRMDLQAWEMNGLTPYPWTLLCKPLRKLSQYVFRKKNGQHNCYPLTPR